MKLTILHEENGHTCKPSLSDKPSGMGFKEFFRDARKNCQACEYDLDDGFVGGAPEKRPAPFSVQDRPGEVTPQRSKPGKFGTGRPAPLKADDNDLVKILKTLRDTGGERWTRRGDKRGRRIRQKENCSFGHSCPPSPTGKDRDYPIIKDRKLFSDVTGAPLDEYRDYYLKKTNCPVCRGDQERCPNKVSSEFGRAKPFCSEHVMENPYAKEVAGKEAPDPNVDYRETESSWKRIRGKLLQVGDKVVMRKQKGTLIGIDDSMEDGRTHVVRWVSPKTAALEITYVDPTKLDLDY